MRIVDNFRKPMMNLENHGVCRNVFITSIFQSYPM